MSVKRGEVSWSIEVGGVELGVSMLVEWSYEGKLWCRMNELGRYRMIEVSVVSKTNASMHCIAPVANASTCSSYDIRVMSSLTLIPAVALHGSRC